MVPMAHATDGAGSIRIPAACCGLIGLKPSRGLIPQGPTHSDIYGGLVSEGVITRTIRDMTAALQAMAGSDAGAPYAAPTQTAFGDKLRIGVLTESAPDIVVTPEAHSAVNRTVRHLQDLGHA
jgi:amidase